MDFVYYSGFKEKERFRNCIYVLIKTKSRIKKYDMLEDTLYISYNERAVPETGAAEVEKAFRKAGYLDLKVKYIGGGVGWSMSDAEKYYHDQQNKILKEEGLEPLVMTFLNMYIDW